MSSDLVQAFVDSWLRGFLETFEAQVRRSDFR